MDTLRDSEDERSDCSALLQGTVSVAEVLNYLAQDRYLSMSEAAAYAGLSERTLRSRLQEIHCYRPGGKLLFKKSELDEWMLRYREGGDSTDLGRLADEVLEGILGPTE